MIFRKKTHDKRIFSLLDDDAIGILSYSDDDATFDDSLSGRSTSNLPAGTFIGNFAARRIKRFGIALLCATFGAFLFRIGIWQIGHGEEYRQIADNNRTRIHTILPNRGVMMDRNGLLLAWNTPAFHLIANRGDLPEELTQRTERFIAVAQTLSVSPDTFEERYQKAKADQTVLLSDAVPYNAALAFLSHSSDYPGMSVELASTRTYNTNEIPTLSHILGFTAPINDDEYIKVKKLGYRRFDSIGKQGLESSHESELRGIPGIEITEVNAQGNAIRTLQKTDALHGADITLSLDAGFTAAIENILNIRLANAEIKRAAVVVTNPINGEVLSLLSYPSYDANLFARGITQSEYTTLLNDPNAPLFPRATQGEYPSGSTIKPVYAAAALMEKIITPSTSFLSTGGIWLGGRLFPDWRHAGHGQTNVYHAIADSVNTFFYTIGGGTPEFEGLGLERLMQYAILFGFGSKTGIDLPNEADGFLPSKIWKESTKGEPWYLGDTYNISIGQGDFLVTPLQMNRSTAAFANGGTLMTPHLTKDAVPEGVKIIPDDVDVVIKNAMRQTVTNGSSMSMNDLALPVAGKTGTAQWATGKDEHTWFTGFGPFEDPTLAVTVIVEQGGGNYYATPIARDIFEWYFANRQPKE